MKDAPLFPIVNGQYKMDAEPDVRIGVILEEDDKKAVEVQVPCEGYVLDTGSEKVPIPCEVLLQVEATDSGLALVNPADQSTLATGEVLRLIPPASDVALKAGDGVMVKEIVAGRGFHWFKLIDQTLTDVLEFQLSNGQVVMINEIPLETYLIGVITGEMSNECPIEYMKAQAVAARSWLLGQPRPPHPDAPFLWCNDDCCQRYQGTGGWSEQAVQAINECRGEALITKSKHYCDARYSKSTGGFSEDADFIWGEPIEGLTSMMDAPKGSIVARFSPLTEENLREYLTGDWLNECDAYASPNTVSEKTLTKYIGRVDEAGQYFRWTVEVTQESLLESLSKRGGIEDLGKVLDLKTGERGKGGRQAWMDVIYLSTDGSKKTHRIYKDYNIRAAMAMSFLYSSCFVVDFVREEDGSIKTATLRGGGWGHGAGMCQIGGLGRALKGQGYDEILLAYFSEVTLEKIYD